MGSPPPEDGPPEPPDVPAPPSPPNLSIGIPPSGPLLCGFGIPGFQLNAFFTIPKLDFEIPKLFFALSLKCDISDPIDADFGFGGGRQAKTGLDDDPEDT